MAVELLKKIPLFYSLSLEEKRHLLDLSERQTYPEESTIVHEKENSHNIYMILKGKVKVVLFNGDGKEVILNILRTGHYFGEIPIFDRTLPPETIIALEDSDILVMPKKVVIEQIKKKPQMAIEMLTDMSRRVKRMEEWISDLVFLEVRERVIKTLLRFSRESSAFVGNNYVIVPRPPMKEIAALCGTSRETVSRIFCELCKKDLISLTKKHIIISNQL